MPVELAGRFVVAGSLVALAAAVVALVRVLRRPSAHAALFTPILFSFSLGWGFVNYVLATPIAAWALVVHRSRRASRRPCAACFAASGRSGSLCAFAHVLAMLILCVVGAALAVELGWRVHLARRRLRGQRALRAALRATLALLPLVVGCAYCIAVYQRQYDWDPNMYRDPTMEGTAPPLWQKVVVLQRLRDGPLRRRDRPGRPLGRRSAVDGVVGASAWIVAAPRATSPRAGAADRRAVRRADSRVLRDADGARRHAPHLPAARAVGDPRRRARDAPASARERGPGARRLSLRSASSRAPTRSCTARSSPARRATRRPRIDDLPAGDAPRPPSSGSRGPIAFRNGTLTHLAAYYAARKHGTWAFAFARYLSVPVRFKPGAQPPWPAHGWEFERRGLRRRAASTRARSRSSSSRRPRRLPGRRGERARAPARSSSRATRRLRGSSRTTASYWAFDTTGLPDDGTF